MKNNRSPSADIVGLNSASGVLISGPRFSSLMMVEEVMIFSFCGIRWAVSTDG